MSDVNLISYTQAGELIGCHKATVKRLAVAGKLGEIIRLSHKMVRIRRSAVDAYINDNTEVAK